MTAVSRLWLQPCPTETTMTPDMRTGRPRQGDPLHASAPRQGWRAALLSIPDNDVAGNRDLPPADELWGRIQTARSVLSHRFDPTDPDVDLISRVLSGEPLRALIEHG